MDEVTMSGKVDQAVKAAGEAIEGQLRQAIDFDAGLDMMYAEAASGDDGGEAELHFLPRTTAQERRLSARSTGRVWAPLSVVARIVLRWSTRTARFARAALLATGAALLRLRARLLWRRQLAYAVGTTASRRHAGARLGQSGSALQVLYRPRLAASDGSFVGVEAVAQWKHPLHGARRGADLERLLEHTRPRLRDAYGPAVLNQVLRQCRQWLDAGVRIRTTVVLPARFLLAGNLSDLISRSLSRWRVPAALLVVGFREADTAVLWRTGPDGWEDPCATVPGQNARLIRQLGVGLVLVDYTGKLPLRWLSELPLIGLRLDRSLVASLYAEHTHVAAVRAAIRLGHDLELEVTSDGVQSDLSRRLLTRFGVDAIYGPLISAAMTPAQFERWTKLNIVADERQADNVVQMVLDEDNDDTTAPIYDELSRNWLNAQTASFVSDAASSLSDTPTPLAADEPRLDGQAPAGQYAPPQPREPRWTGLKILLAAAAALVGIMGIMGIGYQMARTPSNDATRLAEARSQHVARTPAPRQPPTTIIRVVSVPADSAGPAEEPEWVSPALLRSNGRLHEWTYSRVDVWIDSSSSRSGYELWLVIHREGSYYFPTARIPSTPGQWSVQLKAPPLYLTDQHLSIVSTDASTTRSFTHLLDRGDGVSALPEGAEAICTIHVEAPPVPEPCTRIVARPEAAAVAVAAPRNRPSDDNVPPPSPTPVEGTTVAEDPTAPPPPAGTQQSNSPKTMYCQSA